VPSAAEGVVFLSEAEATPGAADIEEAIAGPFSTGPVSACPEALESDLIKAVILGSRDIFTPKLAEPSAEIEPFIRVAQDINGIMNNIIDRKTVNLLGKSVWKVRLIWPAVCTIYYARYRIFLKFSIILYKNQFDIFKEFVIIRQLFIYFCVIKNQRGYFILL
jgi:hypothetical protein